MWVLVPATLFAVDRVELRDGSVIEGRVIRRSKREVTIKSRRGMLTFRIQKVARIRQDGENWYPPSRRSSRVSVGVRRAAPNSMSGAFSAKAKVLREDLGAALRELNGNRLYAWQPDVTTAVLANETSTYKLMRDGQRDEYFDEIPESLRAPRVTGGLARAPDIQNHPSDDGRLWVLDERPDPINSRVALRVWQRLYWHASLARWLPVHPAKAAFSWEQDQVAKFLRRVATEMSDVDAQEIELVLRALRGERDRDRVAILEDELRRVAQRIGRKWRVGESLFAAHQLGVRIGSAEPEDKVTLALRRREELRRIVDAIPDSDRVLTAAR